MRSPSPHRSTARFISRPRPPRSWLHRPSRSARKHHLGRRSVACRVSAAVSLARPPAGPVIRGLDGDRIRVLQNGLNTIDASSASPDHGVSFDVSNLKSLEVVRGPATLLYGSNAIGGVVNAIDGRIVDEKIDAGNNSRILGSRFSSVDQGYASNFMPRRRPRPRVSPFTSKASRAAEDFRVPGDLSASGFPITIPLPPERLSPARSLKIPTFGLKVSRRPQLCLGRRIRWFLLDANTTRAMALTGRPGGVHRHEPDASRCPRCLLQPAAQDQRISYRFAWSDYEHTGV